MIVRADWVVVGDPTADGVEGGLADDAAVCASVDTAHSAAGRGQSTRPGLRIARGSSICFICPISSSSVGVRDSPR